MIGDGWADNWPDTITLGEAAVQIDFDLYVGEDEDLVLIKREVAAAEHYSWSTAQLDDNDAEDRTGRLQDGLYGVPENVPPVVVLDGAAGRVAIEGLRDGHHRVAIAHEAGRERVPAYVPMPDDCEIRNGECQTHRHY